MPDSISAGGDGADGTLTLLDAGGEPILTAGIDASNSRVTRAELAVGGGGQSGSFRMKDEEGGVTATLDGRSGHLTLGGRSGGATGSISLNDSDGNNTVNINGGFGDQVDVFLGAANIPARIQLTTGGNPGPTISVDGTKNALLFNRAGSNTDSIVEINGNGLIDVGGHKTEGAIVVRAGDDATAIRLHGNGRIFAGARGRRGALVLSDAESRTGASINGDGQVNFGTNATPGKVSLTGSSPDKTITLDAENGEIVSPIVRTNIFSILDRGRVVGSFHAVFGPVQLDLGQVGFSPPGEPDVSGVVTVRGDAGTIMLDGKTGRISVPNADCAEEFDVCGDPEPGSVMVITDDGTLAPSQRAYDTRVAGVVSGAGDYAPALVLDQRDSGRARAPIALIGKVSCRADATNAPIRAGDLLTTSDTPGHAMRASDAARATGAVIGKALAPLESGIGLVPVLVTLR